MTPPIPDLFIELSERFGLMLAMGFAIVTFTPMDKLGTGRDRPAWITGLLILLFGLFGILGTYTGNLVFQSYANLRAMGVITAGLFGGPAVGIGAGLIAGGHRFLIDIGGFSAIPCGLATFAEGAAAGLLASRLPGRSLDWRIALTLGIAGETLHMGLVLLLSRPFSDALALVELIGLPMIAVNSLGAAFFVQILFLQLKLNDLRNSNQAREILSIANQTVGHLRSGFSPESAQATAEIIYQNTSVAAVALTSVDSILAHVGLGADHHLPGHSLRTEGTLRVILDGNPVFLRSRESIGCDFPDCPLHDAIIVPLRKSDELLGTLKLYGSADKPLDNTRFELAKGLADLFSTQIELEDIGIKNQLLAQAEIRRLQAQINPHFLFNSLNTIASFCRTAPSQARELLLDLSHYMRRNLDSSRGLIPLREELEQVRSYLAIEQARFGDRIHAYIHVDPEVEDWPIPPLIIQPLVENCVKHGILGTDSGGIVRLCANKADGNLNVVVEDDGAGMTPKAIENILTFSEHESMSEGIGAQNCNHRLVQLYGSAYALHVESAMNEGTRISFNIPIK